MNSRITRRDFLDGAVLALGALSLDVPRTEAATQAAYPPAQTGFRGQDANSFHVLHALRDRDLNNVIDGQPQEQRARCAIFSAIPKACPSMRTFPGRHANAGARMRAPAKGFAGVNRPQA
jgi:hypothetical protein